MSNNRTCAHPTSFLFGLSLAALVSPALAGTPEQVAAAQFQKANALSVRGPFWADVVMGEGQRLSADLESAIPPAISGESYTGMLGVAASRANSEARVNGYQLSVDAQSVPCELGGTYSYTGNPDGSKYNINLAFDDCRNDAGALIATNGSMALSVNARGSHQSTLASVRLGDSANPLVTETTLLASEPVLTSRFERSYSLAGRFLRRHEAGGVLVGDYDLTASGSFKGVGYFADTEGNVIRSTEDTSIDQFRAQGSWSYNPENGAQDRETKIQRGVIDDTSDFDGVIQSIYRYQFNNLSVTSRWAPDGTHTDVNGEASIIYPADADASCVDGPLRISTPRSLISDGADGFTKGRINIDGNLDVEFDANAAFPIVMRLPGGQTYPFFSVSELEGVGGCFF